MYNSENFNNMSYDYFIRLFGFIKIHKILLHEQIISNALPKWFVCSRWLLQKTCDHKWNKRGIPKMESSFFGDGQSIMIQKVKCQMCGKEECCQYLSGIDTSF